VRSVIPAISGESESPMTRTIAPGTSVGSGAMLSVRVAVSRRARIRARPVASVASHDIALSTAMTTPPPRTQVPSRWRPASPSSPLSAPAETEGTTRTLKSSSAAPVMALTPTVVTGYWSRWSNAYQV
jgi:hypothetical protein